MDHSWKNIPGMKKSFTATKFIMHPDYDKHTLAYDVAILKGRFENVLNYYSYLRHMSFFGKI